MVAIVSGNELGLTNNPLTPRSNAAVGRPGQMSDQVYINAATGNLVVQHQDEYLAAVGPDVAVVRTYNSQGVLDGDNNDNWRIGFYRSLHSLTGTVNTAGSTITKVYGDGAEALFVYDVSRGRYVSTVGEGPHDTLAFSTNQWTWSDGAPGVEEIYSASGQLLQVRDADGNVTQYTYANGLLTQVADASGQTTFLDYNGVNLSKVRVVSQGVTQTLTYYAYDSHGRLAYVVVDYTPEDNTLADRTPYITMYTYDDSAGVSHRIRSITQGDGSSISFTYEQIAGEYRVKTYTDAEGKTATFNYVSVVGTQTDVTSPLGLVTSYVADAEGRLQAVISPSVGGTRLTTAYEYDAAGNITKITDGNGNATVMAYDGNGNLLSRRDAAGDTTEYTYDAANRLIAETTYLTPDPDGAGAQPPADPLTTYYIYDAESHLRFIVSPEGWVTEHLYESNGNRKSTIKYTGGRYSVSGSGAPANPSEADLSSWAAGPTLDRTKNERIDYKYDFRGNLSSTRTYIDLDADGVGATNTLGSLPTLFVYDQRGRLLKTIDPRGVLSADPEDYSTHYAYDGLGRVISTSRWIANVNGSAVTNSTMTVYDDANRTETTVNLSNQLSTTRTYDRRGLLVSVSESTPATAFGTTVYKYDAAGRLRLVSDPLNRQTHTLYDAAGRVSATVDATGALTEFIYDGAGNVVKQIAYANRTSLALLTDAQDNPADVTLETSGVRPVADPARDRITRRVYDGANRLVFVIDPYSATYGYVTRNFYDGAGRLTDVIRYTNVIRLVDLADAPAPDAVIALITPLTQYDRHSRLFYDADGNRIGTLDGEGFLCEYEHDAAGRLRHTVHYAKAAALFTSSGAVDTVPTNALRAGGSFDELKQNIVGQGASADDQNDYTFYNGKGQVIGRLNAENYLSEYAYDAAGNVFIELTHSVKSNAYDGVASGADAVLQLRPASDPNVRALLRAYNGANQLVQLTLYPEQTITKYTYDAAGNLVQTDRAAGTAEERTTLRRYDAKGRVIQELSAEGAAALQAAAGATAQQIDAIWSQYSTTYVYDLAGRRISATDANGYRTLFYYDEADRRRFTVNALGEVSETRYTAFGDVSDTLRYTNRIGTAGLTGGTIDTQLVSGLAAAAQPSGTGADAHTHFNYTLRGILQQTVVAPDDPTATTTTSYSQNAFGEREFVLSPGSAGTRFDRFSYDRRGNQTDTIEDWFDVYRSTSRRYDAFGRVTQRTDGNGTVLRYTYDRLGRQVTATTTDSAPALYLRTSTTYDAFSRVLTQTDARGNVTTYEYDDVNLTFTMTSPEGIRTVTSLNPHGETVSVELIGPDGETVRHTGSEYDKDGNVVRQMRMLEEADLQTETTYDHAGRRIMTRDANGTYVKFVYDRANRLVARIVDPTSIVAPNDNPSGLNLITYYAYDGQGRTLLVAEGLGSGVQRTTKTTYNARGEVVEVVVDPTSIFGINDNPTGLSLRTTYTYDAAGRALTVTDAAGTPEARTTRYVYDNLGRRTSEIKDDGGLNITCDYVYDQNDNVILKTEAAGTPDAQTTRYIYDGVNRLRYSVDALGFVDETLFDNAGNAVAQMRYADPLSASVLDTIRTNPNADAYTLVDNALSLANGDARAMLHVYDRDNRERFRVDALGFVTETQYDAAGQVTETIAYADAVDLAGILQDAGLTPTQIQSLTPRQFRTVLLALLNVDTLTARIVPDNTTADDPEQDQVTRYTFDLAGRLTSTTDAEGYTERYVYDGAGNRIAFTNKKGDTWTYAYDAAGRLVTETTPAVSVTRLTGPALTAITTAEPITTRMTYNALGNVVTRTEADGTADARTTTYIYDRLGRQVQTIFPQVGVYDEAATDYLGRIETPVTPTSTTYYDALGRAVASRDVRGNFSYKAYDPLGRVRYEIDAERYVTEYVYDAFGNQRTLTRYAAALAENNFTAREQAATDTAIQAFTAGEVQALVAAVASSATDRVQTTTYDALNRPVEITQSAALAYDASPGAGPSVFTAGPVTRNTYDGFGQLVKQSSLKNPGADRLAGTADDQWIDTYSYYNGRGERKAQVDALGYLTEYRYDAVGNLIEQTEYATALAYSANAAPGSGEFNAVDYGANPLVPASVASQSTIGFDRTVRYAYDGLNRKVSETQTHVKYYYSISSSLGTELRDLTTRYTYDALGSLTSVTDPSGATTYNYYDTLGRTTAVAEPTRTSETPGQAALPPLSVVAPFGVGLVGAGYVTLTWPPLDQWGPGDVRVKVDYTHKGPSYRTSPIYSFSATEALNGVSFTVENHGVQHVDHVYVWKVVDGEDVLLFDGPGNTSTGTALAWEKSPIAGIRAVLEYRPAGVANASWTSVSTDAGDGIEMRGSRYWVDLSALANDQYEYRLSYYRNGALYTSGTGIFAVSANSSSGSNNVVGTVEEMSDPHVGERLVLRGATAGITGVEIRDAADTLIDVRSTANGGMIELSPGVYAVDISDLARGRYTYRPLGTASALGGEFEAHGGGSPDKPAIQEEVLALDFVGTTSAHYEGVRTRTWVGSGSVTLAWNPIDSWGDGDVLVKVGYRATYSNGSHAWVDSGVRTYSAAAARTGVTVGLGSVAVDSVNHIQVWKVVDGTEVLLFDATNDRYDEKLYIAPLPASAATATLEYRSQGSTGPYQSKNLDVLATSTGQLSGWFAVSYDDIDNGAYDYRVTVKDAAGAAIDLTLFGGNAQGQLSGTFTIVRGGQSLPAPDMSSTMLETPLTTFERDVFGNVVRQTAHAAGATGANAANYFAAAPDVANDQTTLSIYDAFGHVATEADAEGIVTSFSYDAAGNVRKQWRTVSDADLGAYQDTTLYEYDRLGHQVSTTEVAAGAASLTAAVPTVSAVTLESVTNTVVGTSFGVTTIDRDIALNWGAPLPAGDIRITIDYTFVDLFDNTVGRSTTQELSGGLSSTTVAWQDYVVASDPAINVTRVRAWKKVDNDWVEIADSPSSQFGRRVLSWDPPADVAVTASFKYRLLGSGAAWSEILTTEWAADIGGLTDGAEYEYTINFTRAGDSTAFVGMHGRFRNAPWERAVALDTQQVHYNAFGEIDKKGVNDGWQEYFNYDRLGRLLQTNQGNGVQKTVLHDLQGNATVAVDRQKFVVTVYDALGRPIEVSPPAFTSTATLDSIGGSFRVTAERLSYTFGSTVGDDGNGGTSQIVDHRIDLKWGSLDGWGNGQVMVQVDTNLGTQTQTFNAADARNGVTMTWSEPVNPVVPAGGPGANDAANAPLSSLTSISRVQVWMLYDEDSPFDAFSPSGSVKIIDGTADSTFGQRAMWDAPDVPGNIVTFRYRPLGATGAWATAAITLVGNRYVAELGDLPADRYEYEISYRRPQETTAYARGGGEFAVQGPPNPASTHVVATVEQPFISVAARSTVGDEGKLSGSNGTYTQLIDHRVDLKWASLEGWGAGDVKVVVNSNSAQQTRVLSANDGMTGTAVTWSTTFSNTSPNQYNSANDPRQNVSVASVEVWKEVAGEWILVYQTGMSMNKRLLIGGATQALIRIDIEGVGTRNVTALGGGMYAVDIDSFKAGKYVFTPVYASLTNGELDGVRIAPATFEVRGIGTTGTPVVQEQSTQVGIRYNTTVGDEGFVNNGNGTGSLVRSIDYHVEFTWDSLAGWGNGDVRIEFLTSLDATDRVVQMSAADGMTGAIYDWRTNYTFASSSDYLTQFNTANGPSPFGMTVARVRVSKKVNGTWVEVYQSGYPGPSTDARLNITNLSTAAENVTFAYRRAGTADFWQTKTATKQAPGWFTLNDSRITYGTYEYHLSVTQGNGNPVDMSAVGGNPDGTFDGVVTITRTGKGLAESLPAVTRIAPQIERSFDRWGNVLTVSDPRDATWITEFRYDDRNHLVSQIQPTTDIWLADGTNRRDDPYLNDRPTTYQLYDINGNRIAAIDPNGNLQRWRYDEAGQLVSELHPDGGIVKHGFDLFGREVTRSDAVGNLMTYRYDRDGRLVGELHPLGDMTYAYDENGNRISATNGEDETTNYVYDSENRLARTRLPLWTPAGPDSRYFTENAYDALGRKIADLTDLGRQTWTYDYFGRLLAHADLGGGVTSYEYDSAGQLLRQTREGGVDPGQDLRYEYNETGAVKRIVDTALLTETRFEYDAAGNRTRERFASLLTGEVYQDVWMSYDELGRLARIQEGRNDTRYYYDANGNRRRTYASFYEDPATLSTKDYWYVYDGMNRIVLSQGLLQGSQIVITADTGTGSSLVKGQGTELGYDAAGNRKVARFYEGNATDGTALKVEESYVYDGLNRLITSNRAGVLTSARAYDLAGRVKEYTSFSSPGVVKERQVYTYNDNGWVLSQQNYDNATLLVTVSYDYADAYDALGRLTHYTVQNHTGTLYLYDYTYDYLAVDGSRESSVSGTMTVYYSNGTRQSSGNTTSTYDVNGNVVKVVDQRGKDQTRDFIVNTQGQILQKREGGKTQHYYYANGRQVGSVGGIDDAVFDYNYTPVSEAYPASSPSSYVVNAGDTLQGISLAVYGDASLWYLIADANGVQSDADLAAFVGQTLVIPNHVTNVHNTAGTFNVYNPREIIGDKTPTIPTPKPPKPKSGGCGPLQILLIVVVAIVAIVATVFTAGVASLGVAGAVSAGVGGTFSAGAGALSAAAVAVGSAAVGTGTLSAGLGGAALLAGSAAVGSAVSQGIAIAAGLQEEFSFAQVAIAAFGAAVAGPLANAAGGAVGGVVASRFASTTAGTVAQGAVSGLVSNALNQGIAVLVGEQKQFSWAGVAFAAVGGAASSYFASTVGKKFGLNQDPLSARRFSVGEVLRETAVGFAKGAVIQAVSNHGKVDFATIAADNFGNALGNSIVGAAQWYGASDAQKRDIILDRARTTLTQDQFADFVNGVRQHGDIANISPDDLEGILNASAVSYRLTDSQLASASAMLERSQDFGLTPLADPNDKHTYFVPIVIDGTWNDLAKMLTDTNPGIYAGDLLPQDDLRGPMYENGPGTGSEGAIVGGATGAGTKAREEDAIGLLGERIEAIRAQDPDANIILVGFGFSRGAAAIRDFANLVKDGVPVHDASGNLTLDKNVRFGALVLFDTVGSEGIPANDINLGFDFDIPDNVEHILHIRALDELRVGFESIKANAASGVGDFYQDDRFIEFGLPGAHSDIGGSYPNPYSYYALDISYNFLQQLGVPLNPLTTSRYDYDVTHYSPDSLRLHDSDFSLDKALHIFGARTERVYYPQRDPVPVR